MTERNDELSSLLESAAARNAQVSGLSELSRFLQSCGDMEEAVLLLKQQLPHLMKSASGPLYLMAPSRDQLSQSFAWGDDSYGYENTLMVHIRRIREKIENNPSAPASLITVKGLGYKLVV